MSGAPVGLLAGSGELPEALLAALKERGRAVVVVGFKGATSPALARGAARSLMVEAARFSGVIAFLKEAGVREAFMAGRVPHQGVFRTGRADSLTARVLGTLADKRADTLLQAAVWHLGRAGIRVVSALPYLGPLIPSRGVLTRRSPSADAWRDVRFGLAMARGIAGLDVGQTVIVKRQAVVAVEALEGTDAAIRRAGALAGPGCVVVKVAKPKQDFRFDVPVVGPSTVASLHAARAGALVVEAGRTLVLRRAETVRRANASRLSLVAV